jgi:GT2 family glycosyltransferase
MSTRPAVSVVTVVRNDRAGLELTLASVSDQTLESLEHVVIDGASTDGTAEWLAAHHGRVRGSWLSEPDQGIYDAMNKGLERATGSMVVFMNAGDRFPDTATLSRVAADRAARSWRWAYGGVRWMRDGVPVADVRQEPFDLRRFALGRMWVPHQSAYVDTDLIRDLGGFRPEYGVGADQELLMRVAAMSPPRVLPDVLSEFELGGAHSQQTIWQREFAWRRMRLASYGPVPLDLLRTAVKGGFLTARHYAGDQVRSRTHGRISRMPFVRPRGRSEISP